MNVICSLFKFVHLSLWIMHQNIVHEEYAPSDSFLVDFLNYVWLFVLFNFFKNIIYFIIICFITK
jgi:hypothetical protein